jgi:putative hydroxymethylpyrimidine transport system ATP-binding protein
MLLYGRDASAVRALPLARFFLQMSSYRLSFPALSFGNTPFMAASTLALPQGEITCLLGRSGVGKTTLLKSLAGILPSTPETQNPKPVTTTYHPQQDCLLPWCTALENVLFSARLKTRRLTTEQRTTALTLLENVGLREYANHRPAQLSGGMRQRVALARTLFQNTPLVLMDEPFYALDYTTRMELHTLTKRLLHGKTVLLVTHDPFEALTLGTHFLLLEGSPAVLQSIQRTDVQQMLQAAA